MNMKMKNILKFGAMGLSVFLFATSCSDYLDSYPYGRVSEEDMWKTQSLVQGLVGICYNYTERNYNNNDGYYLDGITDDAVVTSTTSSMTKWATGAFLPANDAFDDYYSNDYKGIASANKFLEGGKGLNARYMVDSHYNDLVRFRLQGEAFALRAWFEWDLLQRFGGVGIKSGKLLGFPIVTKVVDVLKDDLDWSRNTYEECVQQILNDCDSAYAYLPLAHRDFLVTDPADLAYAGGRLWGRFDGISTVAIKALMYLTYASPLYNPNNDMTRWEMAAKYAKTVIDFKLNVDGKVTNGFNPVTNVDWTNPNFPGIVWSSRYDNNSSTMESALYPGGFQGGAVVGPTQDLVDAFPMSNGYPKDHPLGAKLYDPQKPYANRDPRFYSMIFYNGATANRANNVKTPMYTFECWGNPDELGNMGKDAAGQSRATRTNLYVKKYIYMGFNPSDASIKRMPHSRFYIRWAHMVLAFAEAANEIGGPDYAVDGLTAKQAMKYLRTRKTYDGASLYDKSDPYLDEVAAQGKSSFREFIHNERRIETAFEGMRYYDLRRWSTAADFSSLNQPVHRPTIVKNADGSFTYGTEVVENRVFTSPYTPFPYTDILRMNKVEQNVGWDNWQ